MAPRNINSSINSSSSRAYVNFFFCFIVSVWAIITSVLFILCSATPRPAVAQAELSGAGAQGDVQVHLRGRSALGRPTRPLQTQHRQLPLRRFDMPCLFFVAWGIGARTTCIRNDKGKGGRTHLLLALFI